MGWLYLLAAGILEIAFSSFLKLSDGFTRPVWTVATFVFGAGSFLVLNLAVRTIALGTAYAVWTGIGAFGTAVIGIMAFQDPVTPERILFLGLIIGAIVGLKFVSPG